MPNNKPKTTQPLHTAFADAQKPLIVHAIDNGATEKHVQHLLQQGAAPDIPDAQGRLPVDAALERHAYQIVKQLMAAGAAPPFYEGDPNGPPLYKGSSETIRAELSRHTALTYFIERGNYYPTIFTLLCNGADVNLENANGVPPLQAAIKRKWPYVVTQLVKEGAWRYPQAPDIDEVVDTTTGTTRLMAVILEGKSGLAVKKLLQDGADPDKPDNNGLTPLALARALDWDYVEDLLIQHGAKADAPFPDPNQMCGPDKDTPLLCYAASYQCCHDNYIDTLLEAGANPNAQDAEGKTALHWAAVFNKIWLFERLMDLGADLDVTDQYGLKPLHYACMNNNEEIACQILNATEDADINTPAGHYGHTPLMMATCREDACELVRELLARGAYINQVDAQAETALSKAVSVRDIAMTKLLLQEGADVAKESPFEVPPISDNTYKVHRHNAPIFSLVNSRHENNLSIAQLLLDAGLDPNTKAQESINGTQAGDSLLYFAMRYRVYELAEMLLKAGADPHGSSSIGETAMHYCLNLGEIKGVQLLLRYGFDPLRHFEYTQKWSNGTEDHHKGSTLDSARALAEKFSDNSKYGDMLKIIEEHIAAENQPAAGKLQKSSPKNPAP